MAGSELLRPVLASRHAAGFSSFMAMVQFSSTYVAALKDVLAERRVLEAVHRAASPALKALLDNPMAYSWWDSTVVFELIGVLVRHLGEAGFKDATFDASHRRMGPIARPLVRVLLALSGSTPEAIFKRVNMFARMGVRGVAASWTPGKAKSGQLSFVFPYDVSKEISLIWWGLIREAFSLLQTGRVFSEDIQPNTHTFMIEWD